MRRIRSPNIVPAQAFENNSFAHWLLVFGLIVTLFTFTGGSAQAGDDMSFRIVNAGNPGQCGGSCPEIIAAEGQISDQTPALFRAFVAEHYERPNLHAIVLLNSYGGKVLAAMQLGKTFRQIGAAVIVAQAGSGPLFAGGECLSACVYALMGGKKRIIPPESQAGIHRMVAYGDGYDSQFSFGSSTRRFDNGTVAALLSRYSAMMGVSPALIAMAEHTSPDGLHILSRAEIAHWHLAASRF